MFFVTFVATDFSIASGGVHEVKWHMGTKKHIDLAKHSVGQKKITAATFRKDMLADQVTAVEIYISMFIAEHNLAADHFNKLCKVMFPDSKIAQGLACGRTKAMAMVKYALATMIKLSNLVVLLLSPSCVIVVMIKQLGSILESW